MTDLGTLGGSYSNGLSVNAFGQITGYSAIVGGVDPHAFLYSDGVMTNLNSLIEPAAGWGLTRASAINDAGQITGYGSINGTTHAFLLTLNATAALPEPATWAMMIAGLASSAARCGGGV